MNANTDTHSRRDSLVTVIGLLVFLLAAATGNALMMLVISAVGLVVMLIVDRRRWGTATWLTLTVSAAVAAVAAFAITIFG